MQLCEAKATGCRARSWKLSFLGLRKVGGEGDYGHARQDSVLAMAPLLN